jgi:HKD family nuclease
MLRLLSSDPWHPNAFQDAIRSHLAWATSASIVVGYVSGDGVELLFKSSADRAKIRYLVFGGVAYSSRLSAASEFVHRYRDWFANGTIRMFVPSTAKHPLEFEPRRVHSKIYYFENQVTGRAAAIVGSANLTMRALTGYQGETSAVYEGEINDPFFQDLRLNIEKTVESAKPLLVDEQISALIKSISSANESATKEVTLQDSRYPGIETGVHIVLAAKSGASQQRPAPGDRIAVHLRRSIREIPKTDNVVHLHFANPALAADESSHLVPNRELGSWRCLVVATARRNEVMLRDTGRTWLFSQDGSLELVSSDDRSLSNVGNRTFFLAEIDSELPQRPFHYAWRRARRIVVVRAGKMQLRSGAQVDLDLPLDNELERRIRFARSSE